MTCSPITHSQDVTLVKTFHAKELIPGWQQSFQIDITDELQGHQEIHLYECNQTKLKFFTPMEVVGSGKLYAQLQQFDWYYMPDKWEHQIALSQLTKGQKILEIGTGSGHFVKRAIAAGLQAQGIDLNAVAVEAAQRQNLPVERLDLEEAVRLYANTFDAVCSFQVLEHVPNPDEFIRWSLELLKPGGMLIYCVPNSESYIKHQEMHLLNMPPHHMLWWSDAAFKSLEKVFPVQLEKVAYEPLTDYHVPHYLSIYEGLLKRHLPFSRVVMNRHTLPWCERLLNLGLRKLITGHSLYVQFRKA
ncbi:class I SAM-dependent methyltransferase [Phormidesmis sp. 146-33]